MKKEREMLSSVKKWKFGQLFGPLTKAQAFMRPGILFQMDRYLTENWNRPARAVRIARIALGATADGQMVDDTAERL